jgi:hypothetical protein
MQESVHKWRKTPNRLPKDAPNILIVMLDDCGFGHPSTFGGEIETPTLSRLAKQGISYKPPPGTDQLKPASPDQFEATTGSFRWVEGNR